MQHRSEPGGPVGGRSASLEFAVAIYVVNGDRVLLVKHRALGTWLPLGGHIEEGETPEDAAIRESLEESGLHVELVGERPTIPVVGTTFLCPPTYLDVHEVSPLHRHVGMIYFARSRSADVRLAAEEHDAIRWFSAEDLSSVSVPTAVRFYAQEAIRRAAAPQ